MMLRLALNSRASFISFCRAGTPGGNCIPASWIFIGVKKWCISLACTCIVRGQEDTAASWAALLTLAGAGLLRKP